MAIEFASSICSIRSREILQEASQLLHWQMHSITAHAV